MNKKTGWTAAAAAVILAGGLGVWSLAGKEGPAELSKQEIKQMVSGYSARTLQADSASISSHQLTVVSQDRKESVIDLPKDEFFVSIAPYIEQTHPCAIHSLTGCQGELGNQPFEVTVTDEEGQTVVEDTMQSYDNGFIDLWLPRNGTYEVTIQHEGKSSTAKITTNEGDNTCVTTMQLT